MTIDHPYVGVKVLPNLIQSGTMERRKRPPLGEFMYARRSALGLTQKDAAELAGTTAAYWAQIENGTVKLPGAALRRGIAEALRVSHVDLLVAAGELTPEEAGHAPGPPAPAIDAELLDLLQRLPPERVGYIKTAMEMAIDAAALQARQSTGVDT